MTRNKYKTKPTKLTKEMRDEICRLIRTGNYIETAVQVVGISKRTFYNWMDRANKEIESAERENRDYYEEEKPYIKLKEHLEIAQARSESDDVEKLKNYAETDPKTIMWRLERKYPEKWGNKQKVQANVEHSGNVNMLPEGLDEKIVEEFAEYLMNKKSDEKHDNK